MYSINPDNSQRIIFVAPSFRPEITATALWRLGKGVNINRFQVTPCSEGTDNFLTVEQIILLPDASDDMIRLAEKSAIEETKSLAESTRQEWRRKLVRQQNKQAYEILKRKVEQADRTYARALNGHKQSYANHVGSKIALRWIQPIPTTGPKQLNGSVNAFRR
jgi:hypothetical protein